MQKRISYNLAEAETQGVLFKPEEDLVDLGYTNISKIGEQNGLLYFKVTITPHIEDKTYIRISENSVQDSQERTAKSEDLEKLIKKK